MFLVQSREKPIGNFPHPLEFPAIYCIVLTGSYSAPGANILFPTWSREVMRDQQWSLYNYIQRPVAINRFEASNYIYIQALWADIY